MTTAAQGPPGPDQPSPPGRLSDDPAEIAALLLGGPQTMSRRDVALQSGVSMVGTRRFWHALGFPLLDSEQQFFTDADLQALRRMARLVRAGRIDEPAALAITRAFARTADRLGSWQVHIVAESVADQAGDGVTEAEKARRAAAAVVELAADLEPLLVYAWRRHLADAVARLLSDATPGDEALPGRRLIGFADLVSFTSVVQRLTERELSQTVQRFEALATDVVTAHGGRVVKTVGDEVLFSSKRVAPGVAIALDLVDALAEDPVLPDVRVGCAYGPVVSRLGDVFGTTVNRASRLSAIASPGNVLVDSGCATALAAQSGFTVRALRRRGLRGVGQVTPHLLTRSRSTTKPRRPS
ncbi:MAG: adenylate/guanylate cyclase domain-containing protein [Dermatophilaceae bacterium]